MTNRSNTDLTSLAAAIAFGAIAMYLLDPDKGRRRRAIARDKAASLFSHAGEFAGKGARDFAHRLDGVRARIRRRHNGHRTPDDLQLIERVRSKLGRVVSHPHAIHVGAYNGRVTVSGPILAPEVQPLLYAVREVPGVAGIDEHLIPFESAGSISSLQGMPARAAANADRPARNWPPALRLAAVVAGSVALAIAGLALSGRDTER
jgi:hypothetical protein